MNKLFIFLLFLTINILNALDEIDLNFVNEPQFTNLESDIKKLNTVLSAQKNAHLNIFAGKIIKQNHSDSLLIDTLNKLKCNLAVPVDFTFEKPKLKPKFKILSSNISASNLNIYKTYTIKTDSMKIALIAVYTPDVLVYGKISSNAKFDYDFFKKIRNKANELKKKGVDKIILVSNLSKTIDKKITMNTPIDAVLSFDYKKRDSGWLSKNVKFYSVLSYKRKFGKLKIIYNKGKIKLRWATVKF